MKIYYILFDNFEGDIDFELYHSKEKAYKRYTYLRNNAKQKEEFCDETDFNINNKMNCFSFFDPNYNEFSTYITIREEKLENLFYDNIIN